MFQEQPGSWGKKKINNKISEYDSELLFLRERPEYAV
jgi:hypothetical protein